ncbi:Kdo2-lipid IVA 3' secondary acyltransferase [Gammaproteobacteria bacterium]
MPISERGAPRRKVSATSPLRADNRERAATLKILLFKGTEKTVSFSPRPEGRSFAGTLMKLPDLLKSVTKSDLVRNLLCWLGANYIKMVHSSNRWEVVGGEIATSFWDSGKPFILAFWHGRILMIPSCWRQGQIIHMLISPHRDGQVIAQVVGHFGIHTVVGSTHKGGSAAFRTLLKALKAGECVGITPDGPQGPRMIASEGIVQIARLSGVPVIPCTFATKRYRLLQTWDRFVVALPFSRGLFIWGQPLTLSAKATAEEQEVFRRSIEDSLNAITTEADRRMGHLPVDLEKGRQFSRQSGMEGGY